MVNLIHVILAFPQTLGRVIWWDIQEKRTQSFRSVSQEVGQSVSQLLNRYWSACEMPREALGTGDAMVKTPTRLSRVEVWRQLYHQSLTYNSTLMQLSSSYIPTSVFHCDDVLPLLQIQDYATENNHLDKNLSNTVPLSRAESLHL